MTSKLKLDESFPTEIDPRNLVELLQYSERKSRLVAHQIRTQRAARYTDGSYPQMIALFEAERWDLVSDVLQGVLSGKTHGELTKG